jgi:hypothetical protein
VLAGLTDVDQGGVLEALGVGGQLRQTAALCSDGVQKRSLVAALRLLIDVVPGQAVAQADVTSGTPEPSISDASCDSNHRINPITSAREIASTASQ